MPFTSIMKALLLLGLWGTSLHAQTLTVSSGITSSALNWRIGGTGINFYDHPLHNISFVAGLDWFHHKSWRLSSGIGFLRKGGMNVQTATDVLGNPVGKIETRATLDYLSVNSTASRDVALTKSVKLFVGAGPQVDILMGNNKKMDTLINRFDSVNNAVLGLLVSMGIQLDFSRFDVRFSGNYFLHATDIASWPTTLSNEGGNVTDRTYGMMFTIGYKLKQ